jgi:hypothetical protein
LDLGTSVAETDRLLEVARVETSTFADFFNDRVDLIPGTKGSGKSALFRTFVQFLPGVLLKSRRVVVAHGVEDPGDPVFNAFREDFDRLSEDEFVAFWCIYLISLAHEQFIKGEQYGEYLKGAQSQVDDFRRACADARIPEIAARKSLRDVLKWTLNALKGWKPRVSYHLPENQGELEFELGRERQQEGREEDTDLSRLPEYMVQIRRTLEAVLRETNLAIWLTIDRLDEIFPRRSRTERLALRGLLRAMKLLSSDQIRVKVFLRDDMLDEVVRGEEGFVALTHITARQADTLRWTQSQILTMVVKRLVANHPLRDYLGINPDRIGASAEYRAEVFYQVFPQSVHRGAKQSPTLKWIYTRCSDGRGVVTPRDALEVLVRAAQYQRDAFYADLAGKSDFIIGPAALKYGVQELSTLKRRNFLQAEFPHLWPHIEKLAGGKATYDEAALRRALGSHVKSVADDLVSIGVLATRTRKGDIVYDIPFLYRYGLDVRQGKA